MIAATSAGVVAVACAVAVGVWIFGARGYTASRGYGLSLTDPATLRATAGTVIYFGLVAVLRGGAAFRVPPGRGACHR
ncbi:MAG TPA: hypothetical protein VLM11_11135 [Streptosporangiaceae bacterium]|nr:hypothetical protein [Streptosporangiaceae bacterium]